MSIRDQIEIIGPGGEIRFYDLNPAKGFTNIGSHPDNDIVIPSPAVAPFHAVLDHRQKPCQLIVLARSGQTLVGGQPLQPNAARALQNWDSIELDGHTLLLMEGVSGAAPMSGAPIYNAPAVAPAPFYAPPPETAAASPTFPAASLPTPAAPLAVQPAVALATIIPAGNIPVADHADDYILTEISAREFTLDVDQSATFDVTIINGSPIVSTFMLTVEGLDPDWVSAPAAVNLFDGQRTTVTVSISPPRRPTSRSGTHYFGVTVTSPEHPGRFSRVGSTLVVNPYYEHTITELSPRQQKLSWTRREGKVTYDISNKGNSEAAFRLDASDDERALQFEFKLDQQGATLAKQAELRLAPEEARTVGVNFNLLKRKFFGVADHQHSFTVTTTPMQGEFTARSLLGQAQSAPLIGPIHLIVLALLFIVLFVLIVRPTIAEFSIIPCDSTQTACDQMEILSSEKKTITLGWRASPFASLKIDHDVGAVERGQGSAQVKPLDTTTYRLTATNFLSIVPWFTDTDEVTIVVDPVAPIIRRFETDKDRLVTGQGDSATLAWEVLNADEVILSAEGALETISTDQYTGRKIVAPAGEGKYFLEARNRYATKKSKTIVINAVAPTNTPVPVPVILRFDALPSPVVAGGEVTLEWSATNAEKVRIDPLGQEFLPTGKVVIKPDQTTTYILTAINGPEERKLTRDVVVVQPTSTPPPPGTPVIDFFTGTPLEVAMGSSNASNIQLAWSVSGEHTNIELSSDTLGKISGLPAQGTQTVSVNDKDVQFVLTAFNGSLSASQTVTIKVVVPVPVISGLNPASTTNVGGSGFAITISGANFVSGSTARWNGSDRTTTFVSATQLTMTITSADIAKAGTASVTVFNPTDAGGGESGSATFYINNPTPVLSSINPTTATVGDSDTTLVVTGSNFIADSKVRWNGVDLTTTFNSSTQLTAVIPEDKLTKAGTASVTVYNPTPGGGTSGSQTFTIENPVPTVTSVGPPSFATVGDDATNITINGTGFVGGSNGTKVSWDGDVRSGIYGSDTQMSIIIPASDLLTPGTVDVGVINPVPGGGPSNAVSFTIKRAPVNITLSAAPLSPVSGQNVSFTASVSPVSSTVPYTPGGTVTFINTTSGATLGTETLNTSNPPSATISNNFFAAGTYNITATYNGDTYFDVKTSSPLSYTVSKANVTISIVSSPNPSGWCSAVTLTANVAAASPGSANPQGPQGGTVQFLKGGSPIGPAITLPASGSASYTTGLTELDGGSNQITASYDGAADNNFNSGSMSTPYIQTVTEAQPSVTVSSSPSTYGGSATLTATVGSVCGVTPNSGALVTFKEGSTTLGTAFLSGGTATFTVPAYTFNAGTHNVTAEYDGSADPNFSNATSPSHAHLVNEADATTLMISTNPNPSSYAQSVTFSASVSSSAGTPGSGTISFYSNTVGGVLCTSAISGGVASCSSNVLPGGNPTITAVYNGEDPNFLSSLTSPGLNHTVNRINPSISIGGTSGVWNNIGSGGITGSWTVWLSGPLATPTGSVTFHFVSSYSNGDCPNTDDHHVHGTSSLGGGSASYSHPIWNTEGAFAVAAEYAGDGNYNGIWSSWVRGLERPCGGADLGLNFTINH